MSAPPIGSTNMFPSTAADTSSRRKSPSVSPAARHSAAGRHERQQGVHGLLGGNLNGPASEAPEACRRRCSSPRRRPIRRSPRTRAGCAVSVGRSPPVSRNCAWAISATAPPPTPLKSATICGIAVIFTLQAMGIPTAVPIAIPTCDQPVVADLLHEQGRHDGDRHPGGGDMFPAARVRGWLSTPQAEDEERNDVARTDEVDPGARTRGGHAASRAVLGLAAGGLGPLLEHLEHAIGDEEAADHVDRAERDRDHQDQLGEEAGSLADQQDAAEQNDPVDRVGRRHQRRMQGVRHLRDHLEAHERGEHENRQLGQQVHMPTTRVAARLRARRRLPRPGAQPGERPRGRCRHRG